MISKLIFIMMEDKTHILYIKILQFKILNKVIYCFKVNTKVKFNL